MTPFLCIIEFSMIEGMCCAFIIIYLHHIGSSSVQAPTWSMKSVQVCGPTLPNLCSASTAGILSGPGKGRAVEGPFCLSYSRLSVHLSHFGLSPGGEGVGEMSENCGFNCPDLLYNLLANLYSPLAVLSGNTYVLLCTSTKRYKRG